MNGSLLTRRRLLKTVAGVLVASLPTTGLLAAGETSVAAEGA